LNLDKYIPQIEDYLNDKNKSGFEAELKNNPELKAAYNAYLKSQDILTANNYDYLSNRLNKIINNPAEEVSTKSSLNYRWIILSVIALSLILAFLKFNPFLQAKQSYAELAIEPNSSNNRGSQFESEVYKLLNKNQFDSCFELLQEQDSLNSNELFILSYLSTQLPNKNSELLNSYYHKFAKESTYVNSITWNYIIYFLESDQRAKADILLDEILESKDHPLYIRAKGLKTQLN